MTGFWVGLATDNAIFVILFIMWTMVVLLGILVPNFINIALSNLSSNIHCEEINMYVNRFIPFWLLRLVVHIFSASFAVLVLLSSYMVKNKTIDLDAMELIHWSIAGIGAILGVYTFQGCFRYIWQNIFLWDNFFDNMRRISVTFEYLFSILLLFVFTVSCLFFKDYNVYLYSTLVAFILWRITVIILCSISISRIGNSYLHFFLYLCANEILPFIYVYIFLNVFGIVNFI